MGKRNLRKRFVKGLSVHSDDENTNTRASVTKHHATIRPNPHRSEAGFNYNFT